MNEAKEKALWDFVRALARWIGYMDADRWPERLVYDARTVLAEEAPPVKKKCWCGKVGCEDFTTPSGARGTDHTKGIGTGVGEAPPPLKWECVRCGAEYTGHSGQCPNCGVKSKEAPPLKEPDTKAILEALDSALRALAEQITDSPEPLNDVDAECRAAFPVLSALRSRIEKECPFLEAAMAYFEDIDESSFGVAMLAFRTLTEKPPEEGEK